MIYSLFYLFLNAFFFSLHSNRTVSVEVPAGVETGLSIQMAGEGAEGDKGAPRGDLYVQLDVQADPYFDRSGSDVHVTANVGVAQVI